MENTAPWKSRLVAYKGKSPAVPEPYFLAPDCWLTGAVTLGREVTILFNAVLRGDINPIIVGDRSNIQDGAMVHTSRGLGPCTIGSDVTVGHHVCLHGCTIKDRVIVGMNSTVLDNAVVEEDCLIGANSLVTMGTVIPKGSLAFGNPCKVVRKLTEEEIAGIISSARAYQAVGMEYRNQLG